MIGGIFNPYYLGFSLMFTACIGITQVISALILSIQYIREKERKRVRIYIFTVLFYFTAIYVIDFFKNNTQMSFSYAVQPIIEDFLKGIIISIQILLMVYFTYIAETITNYEKNKES